MLIKGRDNWLPYYRKDKSSIWVSAELSNGETLYFKEDEGTGRLTSWLEVKNYCSTHVCNVNTVVLQFKSHKVPTDVSGGEAAYLTKSAVGRLGADRSRDCITVGKLIDGEVHKVMWMAPELIEELNTVDKLEDCIQEALIYHGKRENREQ